MSEYRLSNNIGEIYNIDFGFVLINVRFEKQESTKLKLFKFLSGMNKLEKHQLVWIKSG